MLIFQRILPFLTSAILLGAFELLVMTSWGVGFFIPILLIPCIAIWVMIRHEGTWATIVNTLVLTVIYIGGYLIFYLFLETELVKHLLNIIVVSGAFIFFEKVRAPDARFQDIMTQVYSEYKAKQGYSAEEIIGKSKSLKGVLEPFSTQGNIDLAKRAGFNDIMSIFKNVCFEGFLAIK